jgi:predicted DNA-binding transcriptional regulator YafY
MNDQAKIQRTLRLLMMLAGKRWYSPQEINERIGISTRTLYRYLATLEQAGFVVERSANGYRLAADKGSMLTMDRLLHFSHEEALLLHRTISGLQGEAPAKDTLLRKLHTLYDCHLLASPALQDTLEIIEVLQKAMEKKQQCSLHQYRSNHSQTISDRLIEPFEFSDSYDAIWAYEPASGMCKQFKLSRIARATLAPHAWKHEAAHAIPFTDAFGFAAPKAIGTAYLKLTLRARNLLIEEYPLARRFVIDREENGRYSAFLPYADYKGIARFIRGLPEDIEIVDSKRLVGYLKKTEGVEGVEKWG